MRETVIHRKFGLISQFGQQSVPVDSKLFGGPFPISADTFEHFVDVLFFKQVCGFFQGHIFYCSLSKVVEHRDIFHLNYLTLCDGK